MLVTVLAVEGSSMRNPGAHMAVVAEALVIQYHADSPLSYLGCKFVRRLAPFAQELEPSANA